MIRFFFIAIFLLVAFACNTSEKSNTNLRSKYKNGYSIDGTIANNGKSKIIYLFNSNGKKIDSAKISSENQFCIKGLISMPDSYYLMFDTSNNKYPIILENTKYNMLVDGTKSMIIGGELNSKLVAYNAKKMLYAKQKSDLLEDFSKLNIGLRPYLNQVDSIRKIEEALLTSFINENSDNILASVLLDDAAISSKNAIRLRGKMNNIKNKDLLSKMDKLIENLKITEAEAEILRRKPAPLFSGVNLSGSQTSLEQIIKGKKVFLIDFWASWCPPCRLSSSKIKQLYNKYKHKGFDVLTVSEDRSVNDWKNGIYEDEIQDWHHIYDDYNRISTKFNVTSLPHFVLLDENGKIIKNKISMSRIEEQLEKIFEQ